MCWGFWERAWGRHRLGSTSRPAPMRGWGKLFKPALIVSCVLVGSLVGWRVGDLVAKLYQLYGRINYRATPLDRGPLSQVLTCSMVTSHHPIRVLEQSQVLRR